MVIPYGISFAFQPGSDKAVNAETLRLLMDTLIKLDEIYLASARRKGLVVPHLFASGVKYGRTDSWDTIPDLYLKQRGDCKSLTAALIAQIRESGGWAVPEFRWLVRPKDGGLDYHILVLTDGRQTFEGYRLGNASGMCDPSKALGMPQ